MRSASLVVILASMAVLSGCDESAAPPAAKPADANTAPAPSDGKPVTITDANFQSEVLDSKQPVVVDIWASWCPPCRAAGPTIDALAKEYSGKVKVGKLDADANKKIAGQYAPNGIPVFLVFNKGKLVHQAIGFDSDKGLRAELVPKLTAALK